MADIIGIDIWTEILSYLEGRELLIMSIVSSQLRNKIKLMTQSLRINATLCTMGMSFDWMNFTTIRLTILRYNHLRYISLPNNMKYLYVDYYNDSTSESHKLCSILCVYTYIVAKFSEIKQINIRYGYYYLYYLKYDGNVSIRTNMIFDFSYIKVDPSILSIHLDDVIPETSFLGSTSLIPLLNASIQTMDGYIPTEKASQSLFKEVGNLSLTSYPSILTKIPNVEITTSYNIFPDYPSIKNPKQRSSISNVIARSITFVYNPLVINSNCICTLTRVHEDTRFIHIVSDCTNKVRVKILHTNPPIDRVYFGNHLEPTVAIYDIQTSYGEVTIKITWTTT